MNLISDSVKIESRSHLVQELASCPIWSRSRPFHGSGPRSRTTQAGFPRQLVRRPVELLIRYSSPSRQYPVACHSLRCARRPIHRYFCCTRRSAMASHVRTLQTRNLAVLSVRWRRKSGDCGGLPARLGTGFRRSTPNVEVCHRGWRGRWPPAAGGPALPTTGRPGCYISRPAV
jgi:hypothetical protein